MDTPGPTLTIGQVARISGVPATTLRYYEKRKLLVPPARVGGQRRFASDVIMRLMVIRFCRTAGLTLSEIQVVLDDLSPGRRLTKDIAAQRILAIEGQIEDLVLARLLMASTIECSCMSVEECQCGAMDEAVDALRATLPQGV